MSFLLNWINKNLIKPDKQNGLDEINGTTNSDQKFITNGSNGTNGTDGIKEPNKLNFPDIIVKKNDSEQMVQTDKIKKWIPNDQLYRRYQDFLTVAGDIQKNKNAELKLISKLKMLVNQYNAESKSDDVASKIAAVQTKQEILNLEAKLKKSQGATEKLESLDTKIIEEWSEYLEEARSFLQSNELDELISIDEILNSVSLGAMMKKNLDGYAVSVNSDKYLELIVLIDTYFNINKTSNYYTNQKYTRDEFENKKKKLLDKINNKDLITDFTKTSNCTALGYNQLDSGNNNLTITGPVQIVTARPLLEGELRNNIPVVQATITDNNYNNYNISTSITEPENISNNSNEPVFVIVPPEPPTIELYEPISLENNTTN